MTRGIAELTRLGEALGGKPETFSGSYRSWRSDRYMYKRT